MLACQPSSDDTTTSTGSTSAATTSTDPTTGSTTAVPTSSTEPDTPTTTTADPSSTTADPTTTTATTSDSTDTGGKNVVFPSDCPDPVVSPFAPAQVDTFFVNEPIVGPGCSLRGDADMPCRDLEFGAAPNYQLFLQQAGQEPDDSVVSVLAARFAAPQPTYTGLPAGLEMFEGTAVKPESWVGARLKFHVFRPARPASWKSTVLQLLRFAAGDTWQSGPGLAFTPCVSPASSFRCRECSSDDQACEQNWASGNLPYAFPFAPVAEFPLTDAPGADGTAVLIDLPADAVSPGAPWLIDEGVMLAPTPEFPIEVLAVHTLEAAQPERRPQLGVLYCDPVLVP